jgi:acyl-coenzyme A synthetase/AMP-(fatty) acid ligase
MPPIFGPATILPTSALVTAIQKLDICEASILPPSVLEPLAKTPEGLEGLCKLDHVIWCGSAFSSSTISSKISSVVPIYAAYGATEAGPLPLVMETQEYHEYMTFSPLVGADFRHYADDLYELVIVKNDMLKASQKVFFIFPNASEWPSKDLMSRHPTKSNMWRYRGRTDDIIVLLNGTNVNPLLMEGIMMMHPKVVSAILTGTGKAETAWLLEVNPPPESSEQTVAWMNELGPTIEKANEAAHNGKVSKGKIVFTTKEKPMLRAGKGTVQRKRTLDAYATELDALYS